MTYRIEDFQNDSAWIPSIGEKLSKIHFRKGHLHAECDPKTGFCEIHYDKQDPHESITSLILHMYDSRLGKVVLGTAAVVLLDQFLTGGKIRKSITRELFGGHSN